MAPNSIHPETNQERRTWARVRRAEIQYGRDLRGVAREIARLVSMLEEGERPETLIRALELYAQTIRPWARASAARMLADVSRRDEAMWNLFARSMSRSLREELAHMPIGQLFRDLQAAQVTLITSLPLKAAQQVHEMVTEARVSTAERAGTLANRIGSLGDITAARAMLIARTEVARAASNIVEARSTFVGSEGYIWHTVGDVDVRDIHKKLNNTYHKWSDPPVAGEKGEKAHPGTIYNCFPGSTKVSLRNGCHYIWRIPYSGELIRLGMGNTAVELTPNHPILTLRGWIAAKDVCLTDYAVKSLLDERVAFDENKQDSQPCFDEVFGALQSHLGCETPSHVRANFHGDVADSHVETVRAELLLPGHHMSKHFETLCNLALTGSDGRALSEGAIRSFLHTQKTDSTGFADTSAPNSFWHGSHAEPVGRAGPPQAYAGRGQYALDNQPGAGISLSNAEHAFPFRIRSDYVSFRNIIPHVVRGLARHMMSANNLNAMDDKALAYEVRAKSDVLGNFLPSLSSCYQSLSVTEVSRTYYCGHVYTMQTATGWFSSTSAAIASKNCRCFAEPVLPDFRTI